MKIKQKLLNLVIRHLISKFFKDGGFVEMREEQAWGIYARMNDENILNILRYRFTNVFASGYSQGGEAFNINKGRLFELFDLMEDIQTAENKLIRIAEIKRREEARAGMKEKMGQIIPNQIKNKLAGFKIKKQKPE